MMRVALTGATGLLGRNLLFEIVKRNLHALDRLQVVVLGRRWRGQRLKDRVRDILLTDGSQYIGLSEESGTILREFCEGNVHCIEMDLELDGLCLDDGALHALQSEAVDFLFHCAAMANLRDTPAVRWALENTNVRGTERLLNLAATLQLREFCYVGSAYSCGVASGVIRPDYADLTQEFRNPYERTKLEAEAFVRQFEQTTGIRCRYFRPSVICGRLIEPPLGSISKFDVLYGWGAFFLQLKAEALKPGQDLYATPCTLPIRLAVNPRGGLNIVPVDFVAKAIWEVCANQAHQRSYHIANSEETPHTHYGSLILETLNIDGCEFVEGIPADPNSLEKLYYKTVGRIFTPYVQSAPMIFDTSSTDSILERTGLRCPPVNAANLRILIDYAKERDFGVDLKGRGGRAGTGRLRPGMRLQKAG